MTTLFQTQRLDSREMEIEEKLLTIHHNLGCKVIPKLILDPFHEDLDNEPEDDHEDRELWEEQLGIKLAVRMIDNAVYEMASKLHHSREGEEKLKIINNQLDKEKENVLRENLDLKNDMLSAKEQKANLDNELLAVKTKFKRLKNEYDKLIRGEDSSSNKRSGGLPLPDAKKLKGPSPVFPANRSPLSSVQANTLPSPAEIDTTPTMPTIKRSRSRVLAGRKSPKKMEKGFHGDPSFVAETMKIAPSPSLLNPLDTQEVPESPEKHSSSLGLSQSAPPSPVLRNSRGKGLQMKHKNRSNGPAGDDKDPSKAHSTASDPGKKAGSSDFLDPNAFRQKISPTVVSTNAPRQKVSPTEFPESLSDNSRNRVGRVAPGVQSTIDKKAYQDLDQDFPPNKRPKQGWEPNDQDIIPKKPTFLDDSSSDFESPNLLKKTKKVDREDEIEDFASPPANDGGEKAKNPEPGKIARTNSASFKKPKIKKVENRWGIEVSELTKSQSKRLKNQKQSKLDNFFGAKAKTNVKRTKTDKEMEEVLKLSKETFELEQKQMSTSSKRNSQNAREPVQLNSREPAQLNSREPAQLNSREPVSKRGREPIDDLDFSPDEAGPSSPNYAYINKVVRGRDERKKLRGFDCYECEEYYKSKLEEGYSEEQVQQMMNDCSKHRGKYKPPLTPEKFWDPEMIEGDPESPRNKTQVQTKPFNNRARRRALNKEKNKVRKLESEKDDVDIDDLI